MRWNSLSEVIWDEFREQFAPGAFKDSPASGSDVRALYEHNYTQLLGRTKSGTLVLSEDDTGLRFELTPPNTQLGNDVLELVERGDISGMSFGFRALKESSGYYSYTVYSHCYRCRAAGDHRYFYACLP